MNLRSLIATAIGIAIYRAVGAPLIEKYRTWKAGPRQVVARRNWRGVYVPDLAIIRVERIVWLALLGFVALGAAVGWTIMVHH